MGSGFDRLIKAMEFERKRSRQSVPLAKRISDLLREENPFFVCRDGTKYPVDRKDLESVTSTLKEEELTDLPLPIYLRTAPSLGRGFYRMLGVESGSEIERNHSKILFELLGTKPRNYLYSYEVQRLKREIPSVIHVFY